MCVVCVSFFSFELLGAKGKDIVEIRGHETVRQLSVDCMHININNQRPGNREINDRRCNMVVFRQYEQKCCGKNLSFEFIFETKT